MELTWLLKIVYINNEVLNNFKLTMLESLRLD